MFWVWPPLHNVCLQGNPPLPGDTESFVILCWTMGARGFPSTFATIIVCICGFRTVLRYSQNSTSYLLTPSQIRISFDLRPNSVWKIPLPSEYSYLCKYLLLPFVKNWVNHGKILAIMLQHFIKWDKPTLLYSVDPEPKDWLRSGNSKRSNFLL